MEKLCNCGSGEWSYWIYDGYGIELCRACPKCQAEKLKGYRSDIMSRYPTSDQIEPVY